MKLNVTVCQLHDNRTRFEDDWQKLTQHVKAQGSDVVLLPEMPFTRWFARTKQFDPDTWQEAVQAHERWQPRLAELGPAVVLSTRPLNGRGCRLNEGFVWESSGERAAHTKYYLPEDPGFWEASWYDRGDGKFDVVEGRGLRIGFLICTEMWFFERARAYGKVGIHLLVTPRATGAESVDKWLAGGRAAAVVSGAYGLSSNRVSAEDEPAEYGGQGWVIGPDGDVLALTSRTAPFVTVEIDTALAQEAKYTYPRYVLE